MAYLGRRGALAPLTSADIPVGIVEGTDVAFLENASATQNLSGTYSTERMYLNDSYTLTGDVTVTGHLALGSIADEDIVITQDGTERTITGSGTIDSGNVLQDTHRTSLTDMTGELGSAVTGSPNLNLGNATFPNGLMRHLTVHTLSGGTVTLNADTQLHLEQVSITSGSKVKIEYAFNCEDLDSTTSNYFNVFLTGATGASYGATTSGHRVNYAMLHAVTYEERASMSFIMVDTPSTTNPTYGVYFDSVASGSTRYFHSSFILTEIYQ